MTNSSTPKKVMVALSGGVDSTVAAMLLKEQGYDVMGVVFVLSDLHQTAEVEAKKSAEQLGIPLVIRREKGMFEKRVIDPFCAEYMAGRTPNPCVICNPTVKFQLLLETAQEYGCDFIATGHYANIVSKDGIYTIRREHIKKDQSYMLYRLTQEQLSGLIFPLSKYTKPEVREIAKGAGFACAESPDSQDICFVENGKHTELVEKRCGMSKIGNFISPEGEVVARHKGVANYTVGQRKGLGIALGKPVFVKEILQNGDVELSYSGDEYASKMTVTDVVAHTPDGLIPSNCDVKIRFAAQPTPAKISVNDNNSITVSFDLPQRAPAPGQSAVFYSGDILVGGGIIDKVHY